MKLPLSFNEIVNEIACFTELPRDEVEHRVWMEALETGWNVMQDAAHFGVTPHHFNDNMVRLYSEGYGYIFDSLVFWARPSRQLWARHALERIDLYCTRAGFPAREVHVLMLGDGAGNDSLYLADHGLNIDYFDVPGSKTFDFAMRRFEFYGLLGRCIHVVTDYQECLSRQYDAVLSFEVLEHLQEPLQAIQDISTMVKTGGIALITEDFGDIADHIPTHLLCSANLIGKTPFLFLRNSMRLTWFSQDTRFKPYEFVKQEKITLRHRLELLKDHRIRGSYLSWYTNRLIRLIGKVPYVGGKHG